MFKKFRCEIIGVLVFSLALFLMIAQASYHPTDPSFSVFAYRRAENWCGLVGSFVSDLLYQVLGLGAWYLGLALLILGWRNIRNQESGWGNYVLGGITLVIVTALLNLYFPDTKMFQSHIYVGGYLGFGISRGLLNLLNVVGTSIVLWSSLIVSMILFSQRSIREILPLISEIGEKFNFVMRKLVRSLQVLPLPSMGSDLVPDIQGLPAEDRPSKAEQKKKAVLELKLKEDREVEDVEEEVEVLGGLNNSNKDNRAQPKRKVVAQSKLPSRIENWQMPKLNLLEDPPATRIKVDKEELKRNAEVLTDKLRRFNVEGVVVAMKSGPAVTLFEFKPSADVKLSNITSMENDLSIALSSESLRIIAPIPGRDVVGIESSNSTRETVYLKDLLADSRFWSDDMKLPIALGKQTNGDPQIVDLRKMPHLLVAGSTGSGKSVFTVSSIVGLLFKHSPKTLRMIMIDPKQVDLAAFHKIPHLLMPPIIEAPKAVAALRWAVKEMEKRYRSMSKYAARGLEAYNEIIAELEPEEQEKALIENEEYDRQNKRNLMYYHKELPYIVIVVEEFGDLMQIDKVNVEQAVVRLAQLARACGIHLMLAMQSPRKEVVTGLIKTNIPGRISFKVASKMDSRIILDESGAERLLARGDMLFRAPGTDKPMRHHGPWLSDAEINQLAKFWSDQAAPEFDPLAMRALDGDTMEENGGQNQGENRGSLDNDYDEMYDEILAFVSAQKEISASLIQRKYRLGYPRAARLIEIMEREGCVGPANGSKPRQVLISSYTKPE